MLRPQRAAARPAAARRPDVDRAPRRGAGSRTPCTAGDKVIHAHLGAGRTTSSPACCGCCPGGVAGHEQLELVSVAEERARTGGDAAAALETYADRARASRGRGLPGRHLHRRRRRLAASWSTTCSPSRRACTSSPAGPAPPGVHLRPRRARGARRRAGLRARRASTSARSRTSAGRPRCAAHAPPRRASSTTPTRTGVRAVLARAARRVGATPSTSAASPTSPPRPCGPSRRRPTGPPSRDRELRLVRIPPIVRRALRARAASPAGPGVSMPPRRGDHPDRRHPRGVAARRQRVPERSPSSRRRPARPRPTAGLAAHARRGDRPRGRRERDDRPAGQPPPRRLQRRLRPAARRAADAGGRGPVPVGLGHPGSWCSPPTSGSTRAGPS